jgi:hypothetical protein
VRTFYDVRRRRGVRGSEYAFVNSARLQARLHELGIAYEHRIELTPSAAVRQRQYAEDERTGVGKRDRSQLGAAFKSAYGEECLDAFDGGIDLDSGASVRLLGSDTQNLLESHPIRPGDVWHLTCSPRPDLRPPHVEDVVVTAGKPMDRVANLRVAILELVDPWNCELDEIFDGRLAVTDVGTAFLRDEPPLPDHSVGFWVARTALRQSKFDESGNRYWVPRVS